MNDIVCELCGRKFSQITATHLKKAHNITFSEYKMMFPDSETLLSESRQKISDNATKLNSEGKIGFQNGHTVNAGKEPWNKNKTGLQTSWNKGKSKDTCPSLAVSGKKVSEKRKQMYESGELKKLYGKDNPAFGGRYSWNKGKRKEDCRSLEIVSEKVSKKRKQMYKDGELRKLCGEDNPMYGKKLSDQHKKALWGGWKNSYTKPERKLAEMIESFCGWEYVGNGKFYLKTQKKCRVPDFINRDKKKIIEVYGDYWHKGEDPCDKISEYKEIGWDCIVLWEHEIMSDEFSIEKIQYFL